MKLVACDPLAQRPRLDVFFAGHRAAVATSGLLVNVSLDRPAHVHGTGSTPVGMTRTT
jgi:hypothetical protein